jgi:hypothetical protein
VGNVLEKQCRMRYVLSRGFTVLKKDESLGCSIQEGLKIYVFFEIYFLLLLM